MAFHKWLWFVYYDNLLQMMYRIAGNFRGAKYSWFSWLEVWPRIFYPRIATLPTFTYNPSSNHENITHEMSQYCWTFCPPKITRYTVVVNIIMLLTYQSVNLTIQNSLGNHWQSGEQVENLNDHAQVTGPLWSHENKHPQSRKSTPNYNCKDEPISPDYPISNLLTFVPLC